MKLPAAAVRSAWGLGDQALSSLTNFGVGIIVARTFGPRALGGFSIAFATYLIAMSVARALASEPLVVRYSTASRSEWLEAARRATGVSALVGVVAGVLCASVGILVPGQVGIGLVALAACLPGLLVQDCWRFAFMASANPRAALLNDAVWAGTLVPLLAAVVLSGTPRLRWAILAWGGGASLAALVGMVQARAVPRPRAAARWWREHRSLAARFAVESIGLTVTIQLSLFGIGAVAGAAALGAFRGGLLLYGPVQVLLLAVPLVAIPEAARGIQAGLDLRRMAAFVGGGLALAALVSGAILMALPDETGTWILGETWAVARPLLFPLALSVAGSGVMIGPHVGLRALRAARRSLRARAITSGLLLIGSVGGAAVSGAGGAAWGWAAGMWLGAAAWWWELIAEPAPKGPEAAPVPAEQLEETPSF